MDFLKSIFMNIFLGIRSSKDFASQFHGFEPFFNKELINENNDSFYGYISEIKPEIEYKGCIIILHGISDNRRDFVANYHFKNNMKDDFLYVIPEFPGFGESNLSFTKIGCYKMILMWMAYVKQVYSIDDFTIIGQSFGSTLALDFYDFMFRNEMLEKKKKMKPTCLRPDSSAIEPKSRMELDNGETFNIRKIILYSPFAITHIAVLQYCCLYWARSVLQPIIKYLINEEIDFDLTKISTNLDGSIVKIIYTSADREVPSSNSMEIKKVLKGAQLVEFHDHNHINLFIDDKIWDENYGEINEEEKSEETEMFTNVLVDPKFIGLVDLLN